MLSLIAHSHIPCLFPPLMYLFFLLPSLPLSLSLSPTLSPSSPFFPFTFFSGSGAKAPGTRGSTYCLVHMRGQSRKGP